MVDAGATLHIINDIKKFKSYDIAFQPETIIWSWLMKQKLVMW